MAVLGVTNKPLKAPSIPSFTKGKGKKYKLIKTIKKRGKKPKSNVNAFQLPMPKPTQISLRPKFGAGKMVSSTATAGARTVAPRLRSR